MNSSQYCVIAGRNLPWSAVLKSRAATDVKAATPEMKYIYAWTEDAWRVRNGLFSMANRMRDTIEREVRRSSVAERRALTFTRTGLEYTISAYPRSDVLQLRLKAEGYKEKVQRLAEVKAEIESMNLKLDAELEQKTAEVWDRVFDVVRSSSFKLRNESHYPAIIEILRNDRSLLRRKDDDDSINKLSAQVAAIAEAELLANPLKPPAPRSRYREPRIRNHKIPSAKYTCKVCGRQSSHGSVCSLSCQERLRHSTSKR